MPAWEHSAGEPATDRCRPGIDSVVERSMRSIEAGLEIPVQPGHGWLGPPEIINLVRPGQYQTRPVELFFCFSFNLYLFTSCLPLLSTQPPHNFGIPGIASPTMSEIKCTYPMKNIWRKSNYIEDQRLQIKEIILNISTKEIGNQKIQNTSSK